MLRSMKLSLLAFAAAGAFALTALAAPAQAQSGEPIKIGFGMALTGPLAANGKQALLGMKIWEEEINAKGGLLGRPVKLVYYDDQSNPSTVPGIYTKLLDVDKVDLVVSGYATNMVAPAMPVVMQKNKMFISLFALDVNAEFKYPKYFSMLPTGPNTEGVVHRGLLPGRRWRRTRSRRPSRSPPRTRSSRTTPAKARARTPRSSICKIVYDKTYPPSTTDFTPIVRALQAANADLVIICSYPLSSVGMVQRRQRAELQAEDDRRRDGRPAGHRVQEAARRQAQRHRQLRDLGAVREDDGAGRASSSRSTRRAPAPKASIRSATISAAGAMPTSQRARRGDRRRQEHRGRQDRRLPPQERRSRPSWATGATARTASGPSPA